MERWPHDYAVGVCTVHLGENSGVKEIKSRRKEASKGWGGDGGGADGVLGEERGG